MKKIFFMLLTLSLTLASCSSDSVSTDSGNSNELLLKSTSEVNDNLRALRREALNDLNQGGEIYYYAEIGAVFHTKSKSSIVIPPFSIKTKRGEDINGVLRIDYIEIFDRSKMLVANTPTMALVNGQKELLVTGGEFYLDIRYRREQVEIVSPIKVNIGTWNSEAEPRGMVLWNGDIDQNDNLTWLPADPNDLNFENDGQIFSGREGGVMYDVLIKNSRNFGWCNVDKLIKFPGEKTNIKVVVPQVFNHTNSAVYMAVEGQNNMMFQLDTFDSGNNSFQFPSDLASVGLDVHLIFVAEVNGNYVYSILSAPVGNNSTYTITSNSLIHTTNYQQLEAAIVALP
ncbi:hypothetical protein [Myroides sp. WP-1]|uniref:hypothetical protein n=1 Tax=Myroides sp. WP-1 TaxID=2759944 RepID=UPI0015FD1A93|nr:hypothetical protein [Myroides sp. WP-1]MBB1139178.1 hypothetical protein [Myroides sp. WP-1]